VNPVQKAYQYWIKKEKEKGYYLAPNGSLMRIHPFGVISVYKTLEESFRLAAENSVLTHTDPRCIISCAIAVGLNRGLIRGGNQH
jgi:ADP-ribosylglycohydrolase